MDLTSILTSLNKISMAAFLITLIVLFYEVYLLKRDKNKKIMPRVPEFNEHRSLNPVNITAFDTIGKVKKSNSLIIIVLIIFLLVFALTTVIGSISLNSKSNNQKELRSAVELIYSKGLMIFDKNWRVIKDKDINNLKIGDSIIIAIAKVNGFDIDMARIKVNENNWKLEHATLNYNKDYNAYYQEYQIASSEAALKIDAQLHSKSNGWLGK